ncbi:MULTISPECIES: M20/M25/M40 family metallo-hydrolase [unclassified Streptomyces]|uniref:M20/M25/M40 family metallo-hydrolase n=1 Tax=unclassified Streptomyces TaxID=2593676 RepID=UPI0036F52F05
MAVLFFDIGATLADVSFEADGSLRFRPRPRVLDVLAHFADVRKGIISNPGPGQDDAERAAAALDEAFAGHFTDDHLIHWGPKTSRAIFDEAVTSAGGSADDCVFVGEDHDERAFARAAGMRTAAHPVFAQAAVENRPVLWTRIGLPQGRTLGQLEGLANGTEVVPVHVPSDRLVLAMATVLGAEVLQRGGFTTDLRGSVEDSAAFLVRDDRPVTLTEGFAAASEESGADIETALRATAAYGFLCGEVAGKAAPPVGSLGPAPGGVYVAAPAGVVIEDVHPPGARPGHIERLLPDPALLSRPGVVQTEGFAVEGLAEGFGNGVPSPETVAAVRAAVTPEALRGHVARLSGVDPLVAGQPGKVRSRDASTVDNERVVEALTRRFQELGLTVRRQAFGWRGHRLFNLEAEHRVEGADTAVLVTAHLDSTAASGHFVDADGRPRPYDPAVDPAPGADDDGSGTAAVLTAAECLRALVADGRQPTRNVRFVLFNAEEQGLVGSKFYARAAAAAGDRIVGVFQMDMIAGRQNGSAPTVEIHAGSSVPGPVVDASDALGDLVARTARTIASDVTVQQLTGVDDPAVGRSDHASFHERGWAAVAVSEDLFPSSDGTPGTGTRQYHTPGDTVLDEDHDTEFAASIARCVTTTALTLAGL